MLLTALLACAPAINHAPVLQTSTLPDGDTIEIPTVGTDVAVTADDPDGDELAFRWAIDGVGVDGEETPNASSTGSSYNVYGSNLDGSELSCTITDGEAEIRLAWPMVYVGD